MAPDFTTAVEAVAVRLPDVHASASAVYRQRAMVVIADVKQSTAQLADRASSWIALKRSAFRR